MIIIGIDPDSKAHGVAFYCEEGLYLLESLSLMELNDAIIRIKALRRYQDIEMHIEDVCGVSYSGFHYKKKESQEIRAKKSENVGMCKQAQKEVERLAEYHNIEVVKHKISKCWKKEDKKQFELVTGWNGRSNEDTRSAAYFGWLGWKR
jgi:hypothetical protein